MISALRDEPAVSQNFSYQQDIRYIFKLNNWILGSLGIWPVATRGIRQHASTIAIALCNLALAFAIVPCALHIVYDEKDITLRLKLFGLLAFCLTAMTKYCILAIRRPKILRCIEYVKSDWWQVTLRSDRKMMLKYAATGRNLTIIGASFMYTAGVIYHMILPFCSEHKVNNQTIRPLVYPTYSKFRQSQISPIYEIVYVAHCMCGYTIYSVTAGACGLAALFATHACGQIQMIISRLEDLLDGEKFKQGPTNVHQRIAAIVKNHVRVIRFAAIVEEVLQEVCLVEFTSSVCTICLLEYYCILDWQEDDRIGLATYSLLLVSFCFNVYILCYIGELLMEKSSQIGLICYTIDWYQLSPKSARSLILMIAMASHPIKISAGRMVDLSLLTFGNVLKTSVAYLSFLRALIIIARIKYTMHDHLSINKAHNLLDYQQAKERLIVSASAAYPMGLRSMSRMQSLTIFVIANMSNARESAMPQNSNYQRDIQYVLKLNNWILYTIGILPFTTRGIGRYTFKILIVFCNFIISFAMVPCALHIVYDQKNITIRLKLFGLLTFCLTAMTKYCFLTIRRPKILYCIEHVKNDWWQVTFRSDREQMLKYAATGRNLTIIATSIMYTSAFIYYLILPFCSEHKINNQTVRPLVFPIYSKFRQFQISPVYEIVYIAHCMCGYTIYSVTASACGLAALFVTHACGQIQVILSRLKDLVDGKNFEQSPNVHRRIATIVKSHVRVVRFAAVVEEILQEVCLVELSSSVCTICLLEYYCIVDWQGDDRIGLATYFLIFVSFCFNVYILCYIGQLLMEKSSQIRYICYMINWYQLPSKSARSIILIMAMASHTIKISAGRIVDLSLMTFVNVLKTTVAYLSFLRTLVI